MKLLFISGQGRSGTTLLRDLLDGHLQVAVWPNEWQFVTLYKKYVTKHLNDRISVGEILTCFQKEKNKFNPVLEGSVTDHRLRNKASRFTELNPGFEKKLWIERNKKVNAKEFYYLVANTFKWMHSHDIFCNKCNDPENIMDYISYFREARFIFMIREPISSYISKLKHRSKGLPLSPPSFPHDIFLHSFLEIKEFFKALHFIESMPDLSNNILIIRMEDLRNHQVKQLNNIVNFLEIDYKDSLTRLTYFAQPVPGYFVDPKTKDNGILPIETVIDKEAGLTVKEKKWFSLNKDLFLPYYPDIGDRISQIATTSLFTRSYKYLKKHQNIKKIKFLKLYLELFKS
ncbi:MAG: sulfotransferase [Planctomycetes bacterium]|nr:sulfotransferase [Planctomycetota bacterium]